MTDWYRPDWDKFQIQDLEGQSIPCEVLEVNRDGLHIRVAYVDQKGKKHRDLTGRNIASAPIRYAYRLVPCQQSEPSMWEDRGESDLVGWEGLDFTPAWVTRAKAFFADLRSR